MNNPNKIILHHSATDGGTFESIRRYHIEHNGWRDIGYHYLITKDGVLHKGRDEKDTGAHTKGENTTSIGICLVGNFDRYEPNKKQLDTLYKLLEDIFDRYGKMPIYPHSKFAPKTCPGTQFPLDEVIARTFEEKDWRIEAGEKALKDLVEKGVINSPDYWKNKLTQPVEVWAVLNMINNITRK
ncbi:N-acetylmuramoyl-L-alanine amidase (plasmid) [Crassaminicella thermophila]|uniref:N-acetylmuramoyl-L-alanine amidase n=1 Tax=Crassaminicella thermophila TaxID=2599308 RepID=A0A5C0SGP0_CRATE|nr:peptidoglycan recognition family protein [Crassaminicella thermophila]QEK13735.1 N-acetylmuramoyl-L-alanine amidase [Crassaminicella thermophila]